MKLKYVFFLALLIPMLFLVSCKQGTRKSTTSQAPIADTRGVVTGINVGERAPELVVKSVHGENISLSSLRGKMVLIDFWASWCSPCRYENPIIVKTYMKYQRESFKNAEGFTIYGVSLDRREHDWIGAIEKDSLIWESHVSDLKGWNSAPAAQYGVMSIPSNFLIDGDGIIVAKALRGDALDKKLAEYLK